MFSLICKYCNKEFFEPRKSHMAKRKFCSRKCGDAGIIRHPWNKGKKGLSIGWKKGRKRINIVWNKGLKGLNSGEKNGMWKDGVSKNVHNPNEPKYKGWRSKVFVRDNFTCRMGGKACKNFVQAHHILSWRDYPELRYAVNNGITLCLAHHPRKRAEEKKLIPILTELVKNQKQYY